MPANTNPIFAITPNVAMASFTGATGSRDGAGTVNSIWTPGSSGALLNKIVVKGETQFAAAVVFIWLSLDSGATWRLFDEFLPATGAGSNTALGAREERGYRDMFFASTARIGASISVAPTTGRCVVWVFGEDY